MTVDQAVQLGAVAVSILAAATALVVQLQRLIARADTLLHDMRNTAKQSADQSEKLVALARPLMAGRTTISESAPPHPQETP